MSSDNPFVEMLARYGTPAGEMGPVLFVREVLGATPLPYQEELLKAVARGDRKISVRSGHGCGKSVTLSWAMLWYLLVKYPCKIVVTAPTTAQLFDALFAELKRWISELPPALRVLLDVKADRVELISAPSEAFISARTSRAETPEALQGVHSDNVLLVADEASGVPEQVFEAASGSMSGVISQTPKEMCRGADQSPKLMGVCSTAWARVWALASAVARSAWTRMTANSSPPMRATVSDARTARCKRRATSISSRSPMWWPSESLTRLKWSRSSIITAIRWRCRRAPSSATDRRSASSMRLGRPVRKS